MLWMNVKKSIFNVRMVVSIAICFLVLLMPMLNQIRALIHNGFVSSTDLLSAYTVPFAMSSFVIFAGVFPGLPYAYSFLEEHNCGYLKFIQIRMPRKEYIRQKIIFSGISGGVSMLIPGLLIFVLLDVMTVDTTIANHSSIWEVKIWASCMYIWGGRFVLLLKSILLFLFGFMWAQFSLLISLIVRNKYVAFVMPFLIYEILWMVLDVPILNPIYLIRSDFNRSEWCTWYTPFLIDCLYIMILVLLNVYFIKRQGRQ